VQGGTGAWRLGVVGDAPVVDGDGEVVAVGEGKVIAALSVVFLTERLVG
jgi:hypothetical protein